MTKKELAKELKELQLEVAALKLLIEQLQISINFAGQHTEPTVYEPASSIHKFDPQ